MAKLKDTQIHGDLIVSGEIQNKATTSTEGVVKLNNTVTSTSTTEAATANAVKTAYDLAAGKANASHTHNYAGSSSAGGAATSALTCTGNSATATKLATARTISLAGSVTGSGTFDGSGNLSITTTTNHTHNYAGSSSAGGAATSALTCTGNSATATKLATARTISLAGSVTGSGTFDGSGNLSITTTTNHTHSYLPLSGGTISGAVNFANNTWNKFGDDVYVGDCNTAGMLGIKGSNGNTGIYFAPYASNVGQKLYTNDANTLTLTGSFYVEYEVSANKLVLRDYGTPFECSQYIDFHEAGSNVDYNARLHSAAGILHASSGLNAGNSTGNLKRTTISTSSPSGGANGDVWIQYS